MRGPLRSFSEYCDHVARCFNALQAQSEICALAADKMVAALRAGNKIIFCGNGGSAADSQHLAAELMGRFLFDRAPLAAISLTVDTSALTAIGNDYGYEHVFARQLRGVGKSGDLLFALSTSGNSKNLLAAMDVARDMGITTLALTGAGGGAMAPKADIAIRVPAQETNHIQEMHIALGHWLCGTVEERMSAIPLASGSSEAA